MPTDEASAIILAASITATGGALVFLASEVVRFCTALGARRQVAIDAVLDGLSEVAHDARRPRIAQLWSQSEVRIATRVMRLYGTLAQRDWPLVDWLAIKADQIAEAGDRLEATRLAGEAMGGVTAWLTGGRKARRYFRSEVTRLRVARGEQGAPPT